MPIETGRQSKYLTGLVALTLILVLSWCSSAGADMQTTVTPRLSVEEQYDDNIDLEPDNEISDWITLVSPGFLFELEDRDTVLSLDYEAGFSFYRDETDRNSTRHNAEISLAQELTSHLTLNLSDRFTRSEDPLVEDAGIIEDIQTRRRVFYRNTGEADLSYAFGAEDLLSIGYRNLYVDDRSDENDDSTSHEGFASLDKWFGPRFGVGLTPFYRKSDFDQDDDFDQYGGGITLNYRWRPDKRFYARHDYLNHDFDDPATATARNDYEVHEETLGVDLALGPHTTLLLEGGYYLQDYEDGDDRDGISYAADIVTSTRRASFSLSGSGGYGEAYYSDEDLGTTEYQQVAASVDYLLQEDIRAFASGSYRWEDFFGNDDVEDRQDDVWRTSLGVSVTAWRWITLSLEGIHTERDSDDPTRDFKDNRALFRISAAYPIRF